MAIYTPGRVLLPSRTYGGLVSLAIAQITSIAPARVHRDRDGGTGTLECVATLVTGAEVALTGSQEEVLAAIAAAATFVAPTTADVIDTLTAQVAADTGALGVAVQHAG